MHFSAFFVGLSALVITSLAMPAPETTAEALPVPATMAVAAEIPYQTAGPFAGVLPPNFAKVWVYTGLECGVRDGPSYNMNFISGQDRCIPFRNVGSIIAWYKSSIGKCKVTTHSGSNCRGIEWKPKNKECVRGLFASVRVSCPKFHGR
ncbi:hypothetical protein AA0120_g4598 [Alternaria tenuissima]|uniref:Uncharacterized protein n=1 Tax=Alternaria tenuissima TaxID=119927 RepID=A0AB37W9I7_9PLEO|nr:hypothetical protein AA0115_g9551 [Alternaria tenuissima]RYN93808.1 hypothetical protein AA0120_g4598 [Alternaria tenuissima]